MKTTISITNKILLSLFIFFTTIAYSMPITIEILNKQSNQISYMGKIRLNKGNGWINLGIINPGKNNYIVNEKSNDFPGILCLEDGNDKYAIIFKKNANANKIYLEIHDKTAIFRNYFGPFQNILIKTNDNENSIALIKLSHNYNNLWAITCEGIMSVLINRFKCAIASDPKYMFNASDSDGYGVLFTSFGLFSSYYTMDELSNYRATFDIIEEDGAGMANFFSAEDSDPIATFKFLGAGIFHAKGTGKFQEVDDKNTEKINIHSF